MIDCKIVNAKTGNLDVKVLVELHEAGFFNNSYKVTAKVSEISQQEFSVKGEYWMVRAAFDKFDEKTANEIAESAWKQSQIRWTSGATGAK